MGEIDSNTKIGDFNYTTYINGDYPDRKPIRKQGLYKAC